MRTAALILSFALLLAGAAARAETVHASEIKPAQYFLLLDDSGSMAPSSTKPGTDPDRLAVFAVQGLIDILDDTDALAVARLNGAVEGEKYDPPRPLGGIRKELQERLRLDGKLARYAGKTTHCTAGFDQSAEALNRAFAENPGVTQAMLFLTDGACEEKPGFTFEPFLAKLESHKQKQFHFYLLRFNGLPFTESMVTLASRTGGYAYALDGGSPTDILYPFAQAIARSQNYEPIRLAEGESRLTAHRASRRVRVFAVAAGEGEQLRIEASPVGDGVPPRPSQPRGAKHRFGDAGRTFRYAVLDYSPGEAPVDIKVNAPGWKAVVLPQYRASIRTETLKGACDAPGAAVQSVDVGGAACVRATLVNDNGVEVGAEDFGPNVDFKVEVTDPKSGAKKLLPMNRSSRFLSATLERKDLGAGDWIFAPAIELGLKSGDRVTLRGAASTLGVSSQRLEVRQPSIDFGELVPGDSAVRDLEVDGNFAAGPAELAVVGADKVPGCISFTLDGKSREEGFGQLTVGKHKVGIQIGPVCGATSRSFTVEDSFRLSAGSISTEVPFRVRLDVDWQFPKEISVALKGAETALRPLAFAGNQKGQVAFAVQLEPPAVPWPDELSVVLVGLDDEVLKGDDGKPLRAAKLVVGGDGSQVKGLRFESTSCCRTGAYEARLKLTAKGAKDAPPVMLRVTTEYGGALACYGKRALQGFGVLLALLLVVGIINLVRNSYFIDLDELAKRLQPIVLATEGGARVAKPKTDRVREGLQFTRVDRAVNWIKSNPWRAALSQDHAFRETIDLAPDLKLKPGSGPIVGAQLVPGVANRPVQRVPPGSSNGTLYVTAISKSSFAAWTVLNGGELVRVAGLTLRGQPALAPGKKDVYVEIGSKELAVRDPSEEANTLVGWKFTWR